MKKLKSTIMIILLTFLFLIYHLSFNLTYCQCQSEIDKSCCCNSCKCPKLNPQQDKDNEVINTEISIFLPLKYAKINDLIKEIKIIFLRFPLKLFFLIIDWILTVKIIC